MPYASVGKIDLYYEVSGPEDGDPLLLIHGLGAQMIAWYDGFIEMLEESRFRVIRFDNRDVGLSTKVQHPDDGYTLTDMADDAVGVLDHIGVHRAHIAGQSLGGMVAQRVAIDHPDRVRSLAIIYSAPGPGFRVDDPEVWAVRNRPPAVGREDAITQYIERERLSGQDGIDEHWLHAFAARVIDRDYTPEGADRQARASLDAPDRRKELAELRLPAAVLHGRDDRLLSWAGAIALAEAIPDSELHIFPGMGHQIAPRYWADFVRVIRRTADRAGDR